MVPQNFPNFLLCFTITTNKNKRQIINNTADDNIICVLILYNEVARENSDNIGHRSDDAKRKSVDYFVACG